MVKNAKIVQGSVKIIAGNISRMVVENGEHHTVVLPLILNVIAFIFAQTM